MSGIPPTQTNAAFAPNACRPTSPAPQPQQLNAWLCQTARPASSPEPQPARRLARLPAPSRLGENVPPQTPTAGENLPPRPRRPRLAVDTPHPYSLSDTPLVSGSDQKGKSNDSSFRGNDFCHDRGTSFGTCYFRCNFNEDSSSKVNVT